MSAPLWGKLRLPTRRPERGRKKRGVARIGWGNGDNGKAFLGGQRESARTQHVRALFQRGVEWCCSKLVGRGKKKGGLMKGKRGLVLSINSPTAEDLRKRSNEVCEGSAEMRGGLVSKGKKEKLLGGKGNTPQPEQSWCDLSKTEHLRVACAPGREKLRGRLPSFAQN